MVLLAVGATVDFGSVTTTDPEAAATLAVPSTAPAPSVPPGASGVFYLGPAGHVDFDAISGRVFAVILTHDETIALTPLPVALLPIWPGASLERYDLVVVRPLLEESEWSDVPLPGCGVPYPMAGVATDEVVAVWYAVTDDLHLFVPFPEESSIGEQGEESLIIDWTGVIWTLTLGAETSVERSGSLHLEPDQQVPGIAALSTDNTTLFVGVAQPDDDSAGGLQASQLVAYDTVLNANIWTKTTPVPFDSLAVGPDGIVYAYYSAIVGDGPHPHSALMVIDPTTGSASILISPLELGMGRLLILEP